MAIVVGVRASVASSSRAGSEDATQQPMQIRRSCSSLRCSARSAAVCFGVGCCTVPVGTFARGPTLGAVRETGRGVPTRPGGAGEVGLPFAVWASAGHGIDEIEAANKLQATSHRKEFMDVPPLMRSTASSHDTAGAPMMGRTVARLPLKAAAPVPTTADEAAPRLHRSWRNGPPAPGRHCRRGRRCTGSPLRPGRCHGPAVHRSDASGPETT